MEIVHLDKTCLYEALAKECNCDHDDADCWHDTIGIGCPFGASEDEDTVDCNMITADHWREVFEGKDEQEPQFQFGDKVTLTNSTGSYNGVFNAYTEYGRAYVLLEGEDRCSTEIVRNLKAGWDD